MQGTCAETQRAVQNSAFSSMQLRVVQRCVNAVRLVYQFLMRADFCNFSIIDHNDFIRIAHSRKPMSNDKHRTVCHKVFYRLLHDCFRLVIQRGSRLVQNNYRRIFDESTGNRQSAVSARRKAGRRVRRFPYPDLCPAC